MTVVAIAMVRDEADIIRTTVKHMLGQVDHVLVADNLSTDNTRAILEHLDVDVINDPEPAYLQSKKMTVLAHLARERYGADWIVPFDADEIHYSPFGRIADILEGLASQWLVVPAALYDHVATAHDPAFDDPVERLVWRRRDPAPLPKIACRWRDDLIIEQGNHAASYNGGATVYPGQLVVRHFPYRSIDQMIRKARNGAQAYAATDLDETVGAHWRGYGRILANKGRAGIADVFHTWFWSDNPTADDLVYDPALIAAKAQCPSTF